MVVCCVSWLLSVQIVFEFLTVGSLILWTVVNFGWGDGDPGRVTGTHLVSNDQNQVGVGDLCYREWSLTITFVAVSQYSLERSLLFQSSFIQFIQIGFLVTGSGLGLINVGHL